jgi:hypothetical protein
MEQNKQTDFGSMIGIIIVVIILLVGAFYFVEQRIEKSREFQASINQGEIATTSSDDVTDIEKDATSMNFDDLGSGIDNL